MKGVHFVTSDDHKGLVNAVRRHFQGAVWNRCQTHFSRNVLARAPKRHQPGLKQQLRRMYDSLTLEEARRCLGEIVEEYESLAPGAVAALEEGFYDVMGTLSLPYKYRRKLRTSNGLERLNGEIRRRDRVIRIYPNAESAIRLIGALLVEQDERWSTEKKYMDMQEYYDSLDSSEKKTEAGAAA
ncbi:MAG: Transposase, Mutator family [Synergistetes bacterium ADurb.BinA166]|nr:MAG: Transposase, Mutator family [Synergistetes bacterium ADurb.BinA166]